MDLGKAVALTLLDLLPAFDTIDHNILFNCQGLVQVRVNGTVLTLIKSYLTNYIQKVKLGNSFSNAFSLPYAPQGSVLCPLLYNLYATPLIYIISSFNVAHHLYANDTQIYSALDSRNFDSSIAELTECLVCVQKWIDGVRLKLILKKTEFTVIADRQTRVSLVQKFPTQFLGNSISPSNEVNNFKCYF